MYIKEYIDYLLSVGSSHADIKHSEHGDAAEILEISNMEIEYPIFWIETPDPVLSGDADALSTTYDTAIVVLVDGAEDVMSKKKDNLDIAHRIMMQILWKLFYDQQGRIDLARVRMETILSTMSDDLQGVRAQFDMEIRSNDFCYDELSFIDPDLLLEVTADPDEVITTTEVTFTITISEINGKPTDGTPINVKIGLPEGANSIITGDWLTLGYAGGYHLFQYDGSGGSNILEANGSIGFSMTADITPLPKNQDHIFNCIVEYNSDEANKANNEVDVIVGSSSIPQF